MGFEQALDKNLTGFYERPRRRVGPFIELRSNIPTDECGSGGHALRAKRDWRTSNRIQVPSTRLVEAVQP